MIHFVLGGARSGKSHFAEQQALLLAKKHNKQAVYIATATVIDDEMSARINKHKQDRNDLFQLIESPLALCDTLINAKSGNVYLLDCLTLWLNNVIFAQQILPKKGTQLKVEHQLKQEIEQLIQIFNREFSNEERDIIIVSNEIGLGVVPMGESTRLFVDYCGWLNQGIAKIAQQVTLLTAGIPLTLKPRHHNK